MWSYFYSTAEKSILKLDSIEEFNDFDRKGPITGFGHGLPISKLLIKFFDGHISINSIESIGTDVYIYLKNQEIVD